MAHLIQLTVFYRKVIEAAVGETRETREARGWLLKTTGGRRATHTCDFLNAHNPKPTSHHPPFTSLCLFPVTARPTIVGAPKLLQPTNNPLQQRCLISHNGGSRSHRPDPGRLCSRAPRSTRKCVRRLPWPGHQPARLRRREACVPSCPHTCRNLLPSE